MQHPLRARLSRFRRPRKSWGYSSAHLTLLGPQNPSYGFSEASQHSLPLALDHTPPPAPLPRSSPPAPSRWVEGRETARPGQLANS
nr:MAG TPA: hypothetical protein [Caudoviricetes sp.]